MAGGRGRRSSNANSTRKERSRSRISRGRTRGVSRSSPLEAEEEEPTTVDIGTSVDNDRASIAPGQALSNESPEGEEEEIEDDEEYEEEEVEEEETNVNLFKIEGVGRPLVWVRIKPSNTFEHDLFRVGEDEKKLQIFLEPGDRLQKRKTGPTSAFTFHSDGVLQTQDQEEVFQKTVQELVEKAMRGVSGAVICMGPELSGKNYTLFGPCTKYQDRGLVPRSLEKIFEIIESNQNGFEYHIILSMFYIHKEKIRDLLTLQPYELGKVGDFGPKGLFYEEITSVQHGVSLILRGITGQDLIHQQLEPCSKLHTIVYVDILAKELKREAPEEEEGSASPPQTSGTQNCEESKEWRSRITFAKIASIPVREKPLMPPRYPPDYCVTGGGRQETCGVNWSCPGTFCFDAYGHVPIQPEMRKGSLNSRSRSKSASNRSRSCNDNCDHKCCRGPSGDLAEGISIRKDMYFLEQMFIRAHELRKIHDYYNKLQSLGMFMLMQPLKLAPSQYFRQSKLTHCLKDIVSGTTMVRLVLHIRPERRYIQSTLEAVRFAARARCIRGDPKKKQDYGDCLTIEEKVVNMCQEMGIPKPGESEEGEDPNEETNPKTSSDELKEILAQATTFFEEKLDNLEGSCKNQVKSLFETFRGALIHVFDQDKDTPEDLHSAEEDSEHQEEEEFHDDASDVGDVSELHEVPSTKHRRSRHAVGKSSSKVGKRKHKKHNGSKTDSSGSHKDVHATDVDGNETEPHGEELHAEDNEEHFEDGDEEETQYGHKSSFDATTSDAHQFQQLCWNEFKTSEPGSKIIEEFGQKREHLKKVLGDHDEAQKELAAGMGKLTELELQLDFLEQDRKFMGIQVDERGVPIISSPEELQIRREIQIGCKAERKLMSKLKEIRVQIQEGKCHLDRSKRDVEHIFLEYCMENHGKHAELMNLPLSTLENAVRTTLKRWTRIQRIKSPRKPEEVFDPDSMMGGDSEREFEYLKRIARQQALALLKSYPKRPPWISYY